MTFIHGKTGSSKILSAPAATEQRLSELEQLLGITRQHTEQATEQPVSRLRTRLGLTENTTEQVEQLTEQLNQLTEQQARKLGKLSEQLESIERNADWMNELNQQLKAVIRRLEKLEAARNETVSLLKALIFSTQDSYDALFQLFSGHSHSEKKLILPSVEAVELIQERVAAADERRGELPKQPVDIVAGKHEGRGWRYLKNLDLSIFEGVPVES